MAGDHPYTPIVIDNRLIVVRVADFRHFKQGYWKSLSMHDDFSIGLGICRLGKLWRRVFRPGKQLLFPFYLCRCAFPATQCHTGTKPNLHQSDTGPYLARSLIARFMGQTRGPPGADRTKVCPMLAAWTLLSGLCFCRELTLFLCFPIFFDVTM